MMETPVIVHGTSILARASLSQQSHVIGCFANPYLSATLSQRELVNHTRLSALVHDAVGACVAAHGPLFALAGSVGIVSASLYGCVAVTDCTRSSFQEGGALGVDPVQFSKATHSFPISAVSIAYGLQGPSVAIVGRRNAWIDAVGFSISAIRHRLADAFIVVAYEEIDNCVSGHLTRSGYFNGAKASDHAWRVAEGCAAVVVTSSELAERASIRPLCIPTHWRTGNTRAIPLEEQLVNLRTVHGTAEIALDASPSLNRGLSLSRASDASPYRIPEYDYLGATSAALAVDWLQPQPDETRKSPPLAILSVDERGARSSIVLQPVGAQ
jgi:hypothetical protein